MNASALRRPVLISLALAGCLLTAGCRRDIAPPGGYADPYPDANYPSVVMLDGLQRFVVVGGTQVTKATTGDVLQVTVGIRNTAQQEINAQYRFYFLDVQGRPLDTDPTWQYVRLSSLAQHFVEASATESSAVKWRLEVRPAR